MSVNTVENFSNFTMDTSRGPSLSIWNDFEPLGIRENPALGVEYYEDFLKVGVLVTPTITTQAYYANGLKAFGSSGGTLLPGGIEGGGGLVATETDDNEGINFQLIQLPFKIATNKGKLWFEVRWKISTVVDLDSGIFIGLGDQMTLSATVPIAAAGTMADENFVGMWRLEGDGDQIDTTFKTDGNAQVIVKADAISTTANVHTVAGGLAADTFIKTGFVFDPVNTRLYFYINGVRLNDYYTVTATAGNPFPNDVLLSPLIAMLCGSSNDSILTVDWIRCAQAFV